MKLKELLKIIEVDNLEHFKNAEFLEVRINEKDNKWIFLFEFTEILSFDSLENLKFKIKNKFTDYNPTVKINYKNNMLTKNLLAEYFETVVDLASSEFPSLVILEEFEREYNNFVIIKAGVDDFNIIEEKLAVVLKFLAEYFVKFEYKLEKIEETVSSDELIKEEIGKIEENLNLELKKAESNNFSSTGPIKGKKINICDVPHTFEEVEETSAEKIVVEGKIFKSEVRELAKGAVLVSAYIHDGNDSIKVKKYIRAFENTSKELFEKIVKVNNHLKVSGCINYDKYLKEVIVDFENLQSSQKETTEIIDNAEVKRIELHTHTKMSVMDGITSVKDYVDQAIKWGHKAIAITDHNAVQSFPDFNYATKDKDILPIYGVELNYIDDLNLTIAKGSNEESLLDSDYVILDIETTGFSVNYDDIIEIAAIRVNADGTQLEYNDFVYTDKAISRKITEITSIKNEHLKGAPLIEEAMTRFKEFSKGAILVAHNADFDLSHIYENFRKLGIYETDYPVIDTLTLARVLYDGKLKSFNLKAVSKFLKVELTKHHRAIYDTRATKDIFLHMLNEINMRGVKRLADLNNLIEEDKIHKYQIPKHITILVKNRNGLKNMYKILSCALTTHFFKGGRALRSVIEKYRQDILIGSSCVNGEIFQNALNKDYKTLADAVSFYDYLEVQPPEVYSHLTEGNGPGYIKNIYDVVKKIVKVGKENNILVVGSSDAHHLYKEQAKYRKIYLDTPSVGGGIHPLKRYKSVPTMHFRTTEEMLKDFEFLGEDCYQIVVENTNKIYQVIEKFDLFPKELFTPRDDFFKSRGIDSIKDEVTLMVNNNAKKLYGEQLPKIVEERIEHEIKTIIGRGFGNVYYISHLLVKKSLENNYLVGSRGSVGSSLVATLMNITEVNPLPPHYLCKKCNFSIFKKVGDIKEDLSYPLLRENLQNIISGYDLAPATCPKCGEILKREGQDIPFSTFLGFKGDKVPDIDLNFSGDYQPIAHEDIRQMFGKEYSFRAGTIGTVQEKTAFGYVKGYVERTEQKMRTAEIVRLVCQIEGVKRVTGQHPGGIVVVPHQIDIFDITPIQYPADDVTSSWRTTHFDYHSFESNLFKLDVLGHDDPTVIRYLMDFVDKYPEEFPFNDVYDIPFTDRDVMSLLSSTKVLKLSNDIMSEVGTYGLPELGTPFVRGMLKETRPKSFSELVKISGLSHGTDVWLNNAQDLVLGKQAFGKIPFSEVIGCRDDIMIYLIYQGLDPVDAYNITETARKTGKYLNDEQKALMREKGVPDWYIWSCNQIKYMFPKAHATAYVVMALRIAWFKVHRPIYFYATYFSKRADFFCVESFIGGYNIIKEKIIRLRKMANPTNKDLNLITELEIALEMTSRGFEFKLIDINESASSEFLLAEDKKTLLMPFTTLDGLGKNVADSIVNARKEKKFTSIEDLKKRTRLSKTLTQTLIDLGVLHDLKENDSGAQMTLF